MWPKRSLDGCYGDRGVLPSAAGEVDLLAVQKAAFQSHLVRVPGFVQPQPVLRDGHIGVPLE